MLESVHCMRVAGGRGSEQHHEMKDAEEEQSVIKGLLPCILGVGGVAIAIWLFVYLLYMPPQS